MLGQEKETYPEMNPMGLSLYRCSLGPAGTMSDHTNQLSLAHGLGALVPA